MTTPTLDRGLKVDDREMVAMMALVASAVDLVVGGRDDVGILGATTIVAFLKTWYKFMLSLSGCAGWRRVLLWFQYS